MVEELPFIADMAMRLRAMTVNALAFVFPTWSAACVTFG